MSQRSLKRENWKTEEKKQKKKRRRDEIVIDCIALIDNRAEKLIIIYRGTGTATNCLNR